MYMTEMLAILEGMERGPAGNTSLAAAFSLAQDLPEDEYIVVSETEYTGAGKHVQPQLDFARDNGIEIKFGTVDEDIPGTNLVLPSSPSEFHYKTADLNRMRKSMIKKAVARISGEPTEEDIEYLAVDTNSTVEFVKEILESLK